MSESKQKYDTEIQDALDMLGKGYNEPAAIIEEPRKRLVLREDMSEESTAAWVKLSTAFKPHIKKLKGAPLAVWLFISLSINQDGIAFPGIRTMANELGYSHQAVIDAIKALEVDGYLTVRRGERKYNLYEPEFAANGKGNEPNQSVNLVDSSASMSQLLPPDESTFSPDESSAVDLNKRLTRNNKTVTQKRGDIIDGFYLYGNKELAQEINAVEDILQRLERGLRVNIQRSGKNQTIAKRLLNEEKAGRTLERWLAWCKSSEWRLANMQIYRDLERVWGEWPQAFPQDTGAIPAQPDSDGGFAW